MWLRDDAVLLQGLPLTLTDWHMGKSGASFSITQILPECQDQIQPQSGCTILSILAFGRVFNNGQRTRYSLGKVWAMLPWVIS